MSREKMSDDAPCPECAYDENDYVRIQCETCAMEVDKLLGHLIATREEPATCP